MPSSIAAASALGPSTTSSPTPWTARRRLRHRPPQARRQDGAAQETLQGPTRSPQSVTRKRPVLEPGRKKAYSRVRILGIGRIGGRIRAIVRGSTGFAAHPAHRPLVSEGERGEAGTGLGAAASEDRPIEARQLSGPPGRIAAGWRRGSHSPLRDFEKQPPRSVMSPQPREGRIGHVRASIGTAERRTAERHL